MSVNEYSKITNSNGELSAKKVNSYLKSHCYDFPSKYSEITDVMKSEVENILGNETLLSQLYLFMYKNNIIELESETIHNFTRELESKIYNVDKDELVTNMNDVFYDRKYQATIRDHYLEFPGLTLKSGEYAGDSKKASVRSRFKKTYSLNENNEIVKDGMKFNHLTTLKKEDFIKNNTRIKKVFELEFRVNDPDVFNYLIRAAGLEHYKGKIKDRLSYGIGEKFTLDIDSYSPKLNYLNRLTEKDFKNRLKSTGLKSYLEKNNFDRLIEDIKRKKDIVLVEAEVHKESHLDSGLKLIGLDDENKYPVTAKGFGKALKDHGYEVIKQDIK